jgi:hypothetical protein
MAQGPRGEKRPDDPAAAAVRAVRVALGEIPESVDESATSAHGQLHKPKNPAAVELGRLGGQRGGRARAAKLSDVERSEIARRAAAARWKNDG